MHLLVLASVLHRILISVIEIASFISQLAPADLCMHVDLFLYIIV